MQQQHLQKSTSYNQNNIIIVYRYRIMFVWELYESETGQYVCYDVWRMLYLEKNIEAYMGGY